MRQEVKLTDFSVQQFFMQHKKALTIWKEGDPVKAWFENNILCIKYQSGNWWHYRLNNKKLEWW